MLFGRKAWYIDSKKVIDVARENESENNWDFKYQRAKETKRIAQKCLKRLFGKKKKITTGKYYIIFASPRRTLQVPVSLKNERYVYERFDRVKSRTTIEDVKNKIIECGFSTGYYTKYDNDGNLISRDHNILEIII